MNQINNRENNVNGTGYSNGEGVTFGSGSGGQQPDLGRHQVTARLKWCKEVNKVVMRCFYSSEPTKRGYRKRMLNVWKETGVFELTEQRLADQARAIRSNGWLSEIELEEIQRNLENFHNNIDVRESSSSYDSTRRINTEISEEPVDHDAVVESKSSVGNELSVQDLCNTLKREGLSDADISLVKSVLEGREKGNSPPDNLRNVDRKILKKYAAEINRILKYIPTKNITEMNSLLLAAGRVVQLKVGIKRSDNGKVQEPLWKRRHRLKMSRIRADLGRVEWWKRDESKSSDLKCELERKYLVKKKGISVVIEELKQRIKAVQQKISRYECRTEQYKENRMFEANQRRLYQIIDGIQWNNVQSPEAAESIEFWSGIWSKPTSHNVDTEWLKKLEKDLKDIEKQDDILLDSDKVRVQLRKVPNWKSPGPDGLQGYWLKNFTSCVDRIAKHLQDCLHLHSVQEWMTRGKTSLIMKDREKGPIVNDFRQITCLPLMWKLLTSVLAETMYDHLERNGLLVNEQKGCRKRSRGTKDQLLIDKMIMRNCKRRSCGLAMAWIDYRKAYDLVPHTWLLKCTNLFGIASNMVSLLKNSMNMWRTDLTSGKHVFGEVRIKRRIFQGDSLSPLLFVLALTPLTLILREVKAGYDVREKVRINHLLYMDDLNLYGKNKNK